jgi:hypothetical protein
MGEWQYPKRYGSRSMSRSRKKNPRYPTRKEMITHARIMHTHMRALVGAIEMYGRDAVPPLSETDVHMIADVMDEMTEDGKFIKRYFGI